jgi:adenine-specific DNA-methyltransferase
MKNRLEIARELLSDDGVIFVSIDDNESAYLKILMDEIFLKNNFLNDIIWNSTKSVTNTAIISVSHTHNLVYFKNKNYYIKNRTEFRLVENGDGFSNPDDDIRGAWKADPFQVGGWRPNQQYKITNPTTGVVYAPNEGCSWKNDNIKFQELLNDNRIIFGIDGNSSPQRKRFLFEAKERGRVSKTIWDDVGTTTNGTQHLKALFGKAIFDNPKPEKFIQRIIELSTNEQDIVLDFHLGSGTTCAVTHKMKRQYIGIEQMDYIEDITVERIKKVINGEQGGISEAVDWQGGGEFIYLELDKYNQKFIDDLSIATKDNIINIYDEICKKGFLNYDIELTKIAKNIEEFKILELKLQKEFLISMLNKNQLYKNLSEIEDETLEITTKTKKLNKSFYNILDKE